MHGEMHAPYRAPDRDRSAPAPAPRIEPRPLGRLRSTHASGTTSRRLLGAATALAGVLAMLTLAWPHATLLVAASLGLAALVAGWVVAANVLGLDVVVDVHDGGVVVRRSWRRPRIMRFDDVDALYFRPRPPHAGMVLADGRRRVTLPAGLDERERVLARIETELELPVLGRAQHALASGEPMTFGRIAVELDGLRDEHGDLLAWSDVARVDVEDDAVVVRRKADGGSFVVLHAPDVPYARVLVALLARRAHVLTDGAFWTRYLPR